MWKTLQDRLVIELRLLAVKSIYEANAALLKLLEKHNGQFTVEPRNAASAYMPLDPAINLEHVFTKREFRQLGSGNTFSYNGIIYTLAKPAVMRLRAKMTIEVRDTGRRGAAVASRTSACAPGNRATYASFSNNAKRKNGLCAATQTRRQSSVENRGDLNQD